jgi:hypothetical protein
MASISVIGLVVSAAGGHHTSAVRLFNSSFLICL